MIERETDTTAWVRCTPAFLAMLSDHHIYNSETNVSRWTEKTIVRFKKGCLIEPFTGFYKGDVLCTMGAFSYTHSEVATDISVGRYCSFGGRITWPGSRHPLEAVSTSTAFYFPRSAHVKAGWLETGKDQPFPRIRHDDKPAPVFGNDIWVGQDATFLSGVAVGDGAVIGTNSLVTKSVQSYSIVGGNPAKHIRYRFHDSIRERMARTKWWRLGIKDLSEFPVNDPEEFLMRASDLNGIPDWKPNSLDVWAEVKRLSQ